jgi:DNA polymerase-3 subunit gamma/tau
VVGQGHVVTTLTNSLKLGRLGHAYLFTGGRGVGKTSIARILAKAVNCLSPVDGDACLSCQICLGIAEENFLDIVEIDAASHTGVENVRELIEHVQFAPAVAKKKVFIIDEVHMLSKAAFNALLKTLEEPPDHVVFILATTEIQKVPVTIVSRTQRFDFSRIGYEEMVGRLSEVILKEGLNIPSEVVVHVVVVVVEEAGVAVAVVEEAGVAVADEEVVWLQ